MNTFRLPGLSGERGLAYAFVGRNAQPRPEPLGLARQMAIPCPDGVVTVRQVHSGRCLVVEAPADASGASVAGEGDALATVLPGVALGIATADCLPIVVFDPQARALAVVHAGWRGTVAGVLSAAIGRLADGLGARPGRLIVGIGAGAGACCYRVGDEVIDAFARQRPEALSLIMKREGAATRLDLVEANRLEAVAAGVAPQHIEAVGLCSICSPDRCHSYRRDGAKAGRMWLLAAIRPPAS